MTSVVGIKDTVLALLWQGDPDGAKECIEKERSRLQQQLAELDDLMPSLQGGRVETTLATVSGIAFGNGSGNVHVTELDDHAKDIRRRHILALAEDDEKYDDRVSVTRIVQALDREGFNLGVQENRKSTTVSNILRHSGQYTKLARGVFERNSL